jgi:FAD/FMN-containing dehydrogenase
VTSSEITVLRPTSVAELAEAVTSVPRLRVLGSGSRLGWCAPWEGPVVSSLGLTGIASTRPADGVAVVRAGTPVGDLLVELHGMGLTLPLATGLPEGVSQRGGTVGGLVATGLPHALEPQRIRAELLDVTIDDLGHASGHADELREPLDCRPGFQVVTREAEKLLGRRRVHDAARLDHRHDLLDFGRVRDLP